MLERLAAGAFCVRSFQKSGYTNWIQVLNKVESGSGPADYVHFSRISTKNN